MPDTGCTSPSSVRDVRPVSEFVSQGLRRTNVVSHHDMLFDAMHTEHAASDQDAEASHNLSRFAGLAFEEKTTQRGSDVASLVEISCVNALRLPGRSNSRSVGWIQGNHHTIVFCRSLWAGVRVYW